GIANRFVPSGSPHPPRHIVSGGWEPRTGGSCSPSARPMPDAGYASGVSEYPGMLLAIDPGCDTGWACFEDARLVACGLGDPPPAEVLDGDAQPFQDLIVERPVVYRGTKQPEAIVKLAVKAGEWGGRYGVAG